MNPLRRLFNPLLGPPTPASEHDPNASVTAGYPDSEVEAELWRSILERNGIASTIVGPARPDMYGVVASELHLEVLQRSLDDAREMLGLGKDGRPVNQFAIVDTRRGGDRPGEGGRLMAIDTRWEDVDQLLVRTSRTQEEMLAKAVQAIVEQRFKFPTKAHPSFRSHANIPEVTMAVQVGEAQIAPDIVVVEKRSTGETHLVMTAAVAIREMVNEAEALRAWARYAAIPGQAFYLYVPVGYGREAKRICKKLKINVEGYRTWRTTPRSFEINDVSEAPNPMSALMPPVVRKLLATP